MAHEIIGCYMPNFALSAVGIVLGPDTPTVHTKWQAIQCGVAIYQLAPQQLPKAASTVQPSGG